MSIKNNKKAFEMLFDRPLEPAFTVRDNGNAVFDLPDSFYIKEFSTVKDAFKKRSIGPVQIWIQDLKEKPDLAFTLPLDKKGSFSLFNELHQKIAGELIQIFLDAPNDDTFIGLCAYTKDRVNAVLFQYCYAVALQHRPDTKNIRVRSIAELFPKNFVDPSLFPDARTVGVVFEDPDERLLIEIPPNFTASDREEEQRLGYFREDIGVNSHHWHWHLVYPGSPLEVAKKDRRGELFYYMHHQIVARYNVERFTHELARVKPLNDLQEAITEGYFPKLLRSSNNRTYAGRMVNNVLQNVTRENFEVELAELTRWTQRIEEAIEKGYATNSAGQNIPLDSVKGIDYLGDMIEASALSLNRDFYGNLHNMGHNVIALMHDPDYRFLEEPGVMGDTTTAMRDPIFYRWHSHIDNIFNRHKNKLNPYTTAELGYNGITVEQCQVKIVAQDVPPNTLLTYWQHSVINLANGLDFGPDDHIYASFQHLQHAPFDYNIEIKNDSSELKQGTCRIFLCPKSDEQNKDLTLSEQILLAIELDKFTVQLKPGVSTISRKSDESSVTIPFARTFPTYDKKKPKEDPEEANFNFCGCGWPDHMLLPKGKPEGMKFELFVMISDYTDDAVQQTNKSENVCKDSASFCGLKDDLYPDKRSMGYPFDRRLPGDTLKGLTDGHSNMLKTEVSIVFKNVVIEHKEGEEEK